MPVKIYPIGVAQSNMTMNYTNCFKFFDIVFINATFTVNTGGNMLLFRVADEYKPLNDTDLTLCNHGSHVSLNTEGRIYYGNSGGLPQGTYTLIGIYKYK